MTETRFDRQGIVGGEETIAHLDRSLRGFDIPDTRSPAEVRVPAGDYRVLDTLVSDDGETHYAQLALELADDGDTWICTRWKEHAYAALSTRPLPAPLPATSRSALPNALKELDLLALLPDFDGFHYTPSGARYPFPLRGIGVKQAPPAQNNCCTFVEAIVVGAWQQQFATGFEWNAARHGQMMIASDEDFFSPVTALVAAGIADPLPEDDAPPPPWSVVQAWRKQWSGGHTFIVVDVHSESRRVLTLESNSAYHLDGVGFRAFGNADSFANHGPPPSWWTNEQAWTWERFRANYPFRRACALRVSDIAWARGYEG